MKITRRQLKDIIMNEVSSYQMSKYDQASSNVKMIAEVIIVGMETLSGQDLSQEDKYEYGEDVISMLNKYMEPQGIESLANIFMEMRSGDRSRFDQAAPAKPIDYLDADNDGSLDSDELRDIADNLEG